MIRFDTSKLSVRIVALKTVTTSLGGSISVIDPTRSTKKHEVMTRITVPMAVTRSFIQKTKKITKYLRPVVTALVEYDGHVIAMERHPLVGLGQHDESSPYSEDKWVPKCTSNIELLIKPLVNRADHREWFFDGRYIYAFNHFDHNVVVREGTFLTEDGKFRKVVALSIDTQELSSDQKLAPAERSCLAFVTTRGVASISPPIWKNLSDVGSTQLAKADKESVDEDDEEEDQSTHPIRSSEDKQMPSFNFNKIDDTLSVNLNFALKAGVEIGRTFGYDHVEALQLPRLMIELCTVNLPAIPSEIKATYGIGLQFTHALAWLLGLSRKANTLETYMMMRSLMKHLTQRGTFRNKAFNAQNVFKENQTVETIPLHKLDDLLKDQDFTKMSLSTILEQARIGAKNRSRQTTIQNIGGMLNEE